MLSITLCGWLVAEFFMVVAGSFALLSWIVEQVEPLQAISGLYTRGFPAIALGVASLIMHFHPGYRLELRTTDTPRMRAMPALKETP